MAELDSLVAELKQWRDDWTETDTHEDGSPRGQYKTQVTAVFSEVNGTADLLRTAIGDLGISGDAGTVYGEFARAERQILWVWRAWYFFRDKFQQRRDARFRDVLRAADEVEWSCHRPFFDLPSLKQVRMPAALPYIEPDFSPSALRTDQKQALDLKDDDFKWIKEAFKELPVPLLKIPITAINNPWALVLIGHEAGHIIEPLIAPGFKTIFAKTLRSAIQSAAGPEDYLEADQNAWQAWADEIFADLYSIMTMGKWAVWAMIQFEVAEPDEMLQRRDQYPSAHARLALLAAMAGKFGLAAEAPPAPANIPEQLSRDLGYVPFIATAIAAMPQVQALSKALAFDASAYNTKSKDVKDSKSGEAEQWSRYLLKQGAIPVTRQLRSARMAAAGAAQSWSETVFGETKQEDEALQNLRASAISSIGKAGPLGVRSSVAVAEAAEPGRALFEALKRLSPR